jgi:hypothetical protein
MLDGIAELDAIVGEHRMDAIGDDLGQGLQEAGGGPDVGPLMQLDKGELAGSIDGHEQVELALLGPDLCDVDAKVADGIAPKAFIGLSPYIRQSTDAMALQTAVQRGAREMRDGS